MKTKMQNLLFKKVGISAACAAIFAMGNAHATVDDLVTGTTQFNILEDDSGELVFRPDGLGGYAPVPITGNLQAGDLVFGIFDLPIINGTNIDSQGFELTGAFLLNTVSVDISGGVNDANVTFGAAGSAAWSAITDLVNDGTADGDGINLASVGTGGVSINGTNLTALFFEDPANDLNILTQNVPTAYANAVEGDLKLAVDAGTATATDIWTDLSDIAGGVPGVTIVGNFNFNFNVQYENFANLDPTSYIGSGTNLTSANSAFAVGDDFQGTLAVPEPATMALLGLGLLGMGAIRRQGAKS